MRHPLIISILLFALSGLSMPYQRRAAMLPEVPVPGSPVEGLVDAAHRKAASSSSTSESADAVPGSPPAQAGIAEPTSPDAGVAEMYQMLIEEHWEKENQPILDRIADFQKDQQRQATKFYTDQDADLDTFLKEQAKTGGQSAETLAAKRKSFEDAQKENAAAFDKGQNADEDTFMKTQNDILTQHGANQQKMKDWLEHEAAASFLNS